jgi:DNA polymerase IV (DinB-like DNA polymerase)
MNRIILHVDLDSFYASVEEFRKPGIKGKPIIICIYSGRTKDSGAVSSANYKARDLGIRSGMPIIFAKRLAKKKRAIFLPADRPYYQSVSQRIMDILEKEADAFQQVSVDEAYLDVSETTGGDWEKAIKIAKSIKKKIKEREKLTCSVGIGPNKLVAKMASKNMKPDGLTLVKTPEVRNFLNPLEVSKLHGIGRVTSFILEELGIKTIKDLAEFKVASIEEKLGKNKAKMLQERAIGIDNSTVEEQEAKQISRIGTLKKDSRDIDEIFKKIKELAKDLEKRIESRKVSFRTISLITIDTTLDIQTRSETIEQTQKLVPMISITKELLKDFLEENKYKQLRRVGVRVSNLIYRKKQRTLGDF